ncbi:hypothetical protein AAG570_003319 [Ranatra chinensis]|uniref:Uncharacterized protein n=1 Tax=Ranatra chinensis TaxID=642074 RepID=A0ABD0Y6I9_9HEMI
MIRCWGVRVAQTRLPHVAEHHRPLEHHSMRGPLAVIMWVALVNGEAHRRITLKDPIVGSVQAKKCKTDRDCIENAFCETNHECYCKLNYVPIEGDDAVTCLREATGFGDACRHHLQCTGRMGTRAECRFNSSGVVVTRGMSTGQCLCQHHAHYAEGICHKTSCQ